MLGPDGEQDGYRACMVADPLTATPTEEQQLVLDVVATIYLQHNRWPSWAWLEETMERRNLDAWSIIAGMPTESTHNYGFVWPTRPSSPQPQDQIGLRMAGLRHVQLAAGLVSEFCALVGALGTIRSNVNLDPFANERPVATRQDITQQLRSPMPPNSSLLDFLSKEPATWQCQIRGDLNAEWTIELSPHVRRFAGIRTIDEYLDRLGSLLVPTSPLDRPLVPVSPFSLPASIDYLDTVWRLRFGGPLIGSPGIERSARLAFDVSSPEEADSALSALAEVLKGLRVPGSPGVDGHPLQRIAPFLATQLPSEAVPRVDEAVERLDAARSLRAGAQHVDAQAKAVHAHAVLGLSYPVSDWAAAWAQVQATVAHAIDVIRQELQASD